MQWCTARSAYNTHRPQALFVLFFTICLSLSLSLALSTSSRSHCRKQRRNKDKITHTACTHLKIYTFAQKDNSVSTVDAIPFFSSFHRNYGLKKIWERKKMRSKTCLFRFNRVPRGENCKLKKKGKEINELRDFFLSAINSSPFKSNNGCLKKKK